MRRDRLTRNQLVLVGRDADTAVPTRILDHSPARGVVVLFDCQDPRAFPVRFPLDKLDQLHLSLATSDPFHAPPTPEAYLKQAHRELRDRRWTLVQELLEGVDGGPRGWTDFIFDRAQRGRLVRLASIRTGVSPPTYYDLLKRFWRGGQHPNALLPFPRAKGGPHVPPRDGSRPGRPSRDRREAAHKAFDSELLYQAVEEFTKNLQLELRPKTAYFDATTKVYGETIDLEGREARVFPESAPHVPSLAVLQYHRRLRLSDQALARSITPRHAWDRDNRPRTGTAVDQVRGPGRSYEIDATKWPVNLRSRLDARDSIGQATLYFVVDRYSQAIAGFHVTLDAENSRGALMALANACMDKVEYLRTLGIKITEDKWPIHHVPAELVTDRGSGFTSQLMVEGASALMMTPTHTPARKPQHKGFVENSFNLGERSLLQRRVRATDGRMRRPDHSLDGKLTLPELREVIALEILSLNQNTQVREVPADYFSADGTKPTLLELWNFGVERHGAPTVRSAIDIEMALLPKVDFEWTDKGLRIPETNIRYRFVGPNHDDILVRMKGRKARHWKGMVHSDDVSRAYLILDDGSTVSLALAKSDEERFSDWTRGEVIELKDRGAANQPAKEDLLNHRKSVTRARQEQTVEKAMEAAGGVVATPSTMSRELRKKDDPARSAFRPKERRAAKKSAASRAHVAEAMPAPTPRERSQDALENGVQNALTGIFDDD